MEKATDIRKFRCFYLTNFKRVYIIEVLGSINTTMEMNALIRENFD